MLPCFHHRLLINTQAAVPPEGVYEDLRMPPVLAACCRAGRCQILPCMCQVGCTAAWHVARTSPRQAFDERARRLKQAVLASNRTHARRTTRQALPYRHLTKLPAATGTARYCRLMVMSVHSASLQVVMVALRSAEAPTCRYNTSFCPSHVTFCT